MASLLAQHAEGTLEIADTAVIGVVGWLRTRVPMLAAKQQSRCAAAETEVALTGRLAPFLCGISAAWQRSGLRLPWPNWVD